MKGKRGGNHGGGRPVKPIGEKAVVSGKIRIRIDEETALALQQLMLRPVAGVSTPEDMIRYLVLQELRGDDS